MADDPEERDDEDDLDDDAWEEAQRRKPRQAEPIGQAQYRGRFAVAAFFLILAGAAIYALEIPFPFDFDDPSDSYVIPIVLGLIALVLAIAATRSMIIATRFGTPILDYAPPLMGEQFTAEVVLDKPVAATGDYRLSLTCMAKTVDDFTDDEGGNSYGKRWQENWTVPHAQVAATGKVPISVQLPPPAPGWGSAQSRAYWALVVSAPTPGMDFSFEFQPQIYRP